jgi:hypothetical protein
MAEHCRRPGTLQKTRNIAGDPEHFRRPGTLQETRNIAGDPEHCRRPGTMKKTRNIAEDPNLEFSAPLGQVAGLTMQDIHTLSAGMLAPDFWRWGKVGEDHRLALRLEHPDQERPCQECLRGVAKFEVLTAVLLKLLVRHVC